MKFLADEGVDRPIVAALRELGHDVLFVAEAHPGVDDNTVLNLANQEDRILMTRDKDFGELVFRLKQVHTGIVLNRLHELASEAKVALITRVLAEHSPELYGAYTVIQPGRVRIRRMEE